MTSLTLDTTYAGQLKPNWWLEPFLMGVMVGIGLMILVMTIISSTGGL